MGVPSTRRKSKRKLNLTAPYASFASHCSSCRLRLLKSASLNPGKRQILPKCRWPFACLKQDMAARFKIDQRRSLPTTPETSTRKKSNKLSVPASRHGGWRARSISRAQSMPLTTYRFAFPVNFIIIIFDLHARACRIFVLRSFAETFPGR